MFGNGEFSVKLKENFDPTVFPQQCNHFFFIHIAYSPLFQDCLVAPPASPKARISGRELELSPVGDHGMRKPSVAQTPHHDAQEESADL
ncbi:hypothetical protein RJT34_17316 [Clitoria ternatea]|uniref:Uncharacterized protein n=1 Tax=Clitoria ternatea TaxID=43366 RepID=A0AAN9J925_CLITE